MLSRNPTGTALATVIVMVASFLAAGMLAALTVMFRGGVSAFKLIVPFSACLMMTG